MRRVLPKAIGARIAIMLVRFGRRRRAPGARVGTKRARFRIPGQHRIRLRKLANRPPAIRRAIERCFRGELPF